MALSGPHPFVSAPHNLFRASLPQPAGHLLLLDLLLVLMAMSDPFASAPQNHFRTFHCLSCFFVLEASTRLLRRFRPLVTLLPHPLGWLLWAELIHSVTVPLLSLVLPVIISKEEKKRNEASDSGNRIPGLFPVPFEIVCPLWRCSGRVGVGTRVEGICLENAPVDGLLAPAG